MQRCLATVALLCAMSSIARAQTSGSPSPPPSDESRKKADVQEAVLRYQIATWDLSAVSYCVKVDGKDADKDFLLRLRPLPVMPASQCRKQTPAKLKGLYHVVDKQTKKKAVIFRMGEIRWIKQSEAEIDGGYDCASLCMAHGTYHVVWDGTRWTVSAFNIIIQS